MPRDTYFQSVLGKTAREHCELPMPEQWSGRAKLVEAAKQKLAKPLLKGETNTFCFVCAATVASPPEVTMPTVGDISAPE